MREALVIGVAGLHVALVICGAAGLMWFAPGSPAYRLQGWYGAMSGAGNGYGFFAPGVGAQMRARFVLVGADGLTWEDDLLGDHNNEVRLRIGAVVNLFPLNPEEEALRRDLTASWASLMFARHPDAEKVVILMEAYVVPSMDEHRAGARAEWRLVHRMTFTAERGT